MKIRELLSDASKWTQHYLARKANGTPTSEQDPYAVSWCLVGAVIVCYPQASLSVYEQIEKKTGGEMIDWNNAPERTFEDVRKLVEELDI